jgi:hypothetical protein
VFFLRYFRERHSRFLVGTSDAETVRPPFSVRNIFRLRFRIHPQVIRFATERPENVFPGK